jgi:hypothetical protein
MATAAYNSRRFLSRFSLKTLSGLLRFFGARNYIFYYFFEKFQLNAAQKVHKVMNRLKHATRKDHNQRREIFSFFLFLAKRREGKHIAQWCNFFSECAIIFF